MRELRPVFDATGDPRLKPPLRPWPALRQRVVDLAESGFDPVATIRAARDRYELDTAASVVQVMTWRIDKLVRGGNAPRIGDGTDPNAGPDVDPDVAAALEALRAASASTPNQATSSPLPNPAVRRAEFQRRHDSEIAAMRASH